MNHKKLLTQEQINKDVKELREGSLLLRPIYCAHDTAAETLVNDLLTRLSMPEAASASTDNKRRLVVASFLAIAQQLKLNESTRLCIIHGKDHWADYPAVGHTIIADVRKALEAAQVITKVTGTGRQYFYLNSKGRSVPVSVGTIYDVADDVLGNPLLEETSWLQTGMKRVQVKAFETPSQTYARKAKGDARKTLTRSQFKAHAIKAKDAAGLWTPFVSCEREVERLNTYWRKHPLALEDHRGLRVFVGSCRRVFHNGSMNEGGRYYGSYNQGLNKQFRYQATIDGEPVVEVDINACQPTLFSGLQNKRMNVSETWRDLYMEVVNSLNLSVLELLEAEDTAELQRKKMKQVVLELIGTGNPNKTHPAKDCLYTFSDNIAFGLSEYNVYRNAILDTLPALTSLNDTNNKGAAAISFHESEIMTQTLHTLMHQDVPAYSLHDAVIVKEKDEIVAAEVYRNTFRGYIEEKTDGAVNLLPAVSVEKAGVSRFKLAGGYSQR